MRVDGIVVTILATMFAFAAGAAPKTPPSKAAGPSVRYFELGSGIMGEIAAETTLRETRQGAAVTAAVLDVCYPPSTTSNRKERFVVNLVPSAGKLSGTGQTQVGKEPVTVQFARKAASGTFTFEGTIKIGSAQHTISSADNTDVSETEYRESHTRDEVVIPSPADFIKQSPGSIAVQVNSAALPDLVKLFKSEKARVQLDSLQADCSSLRAGSQTVLLQVDPARAAALVAKFKAAPGVVSAGWASGSYTIDSAVRVPSAEFGGATIDRNKLASAIAASAAKALAASEQSSAWDDVTGELSIKLKRPSESYAGLGLTDRIALTFLPGPEKPGATDKLVIWLGDATIETHDEGPAPQLALVQAPQGEGDPGGDFVDAGTLLAALARDLKGQVWDAEANKWKN